MDKRTKKHIPRRHQRDEDDNRDSRDRDRHRRTRGYSPSRSPSPANHIEVIELSSDSGKEDPEAQRKALELFSRKKRKAVNKPSTSIHQPRKSGRSPSNRQRRSRHSSRKSFSHSTNSDRSKSPCTSRDKGKKRSHHKSRKESSDSSRSDRSKSHSISRDAGKKHSHHRSRNESAASSRRESSKSRRSSRHKGKKASHRSRRSSSSSSNDNRSSRKQSKSGHRHSSCSHRETRRSPSPPISQDPVFSPNAKLSGIIQWETPQNHPVALTRSSSTVNLSSASSSVRTESPQASTSQALPKAQRPSRMRVKNRVGTQKKTTPPLPLREGTISVSTSQTCSEDEYDINELVVVPKYARTNSPPPPKSTLPPPNFPPPSQNHVESTHPAPLDGVLSSRPQPAFSTEKAKIVAQSMLESAKPSSSGPEAPTSQSDYPDLLGVDGKPLRIINRNRRPQTETLQNKAATSTMPEVSSNSSTVPSIAPASSVRPIAPVHFASAAFRAKLPQPNPREIVLKVIPAQPSPNLFALGRLGTNPRSLPQSSSVNVASQQFSTSQTRTHSPPQAKSLQNQPAHSSTPEESSESSTGMVGPDGRPMRLSTWRPPQRRQIASNMLQNATSPSSTPEVPSKSSTVPAIAHVSSVRPVAPEHFAAAYFRAKLPQPNPREIVSKVIPTQPLRNPFAQCGLVANRSVVPQSSTSNEASALFIKSQAGHHSAPPAKPLQNHLASSSTLDRSGLNSERAPDGCPIIRGAMRDTYGRKSVGSSRQRARPNPIEIAPLVIPVEYSRLSTSQSGVNTSAPAKYIPEVYSKNVEFDEKTRRWVPGKAEKKEKPVMDPRAKIGDLSCPLYVEFVAKELEFTMTCTEGLAQLCKCLNAQIEQNEKALDDAGEKWDPAESLEANFDHYNEVYRQHGLFDFDGALKDLVKDDDTRAALVLDLRRRSIHITIDKRARWQQILKRHPEYMASELKRLALCSETNADKTTRVTLSSRFGKFLKRIGATDDEIINTFVTTRPFLDLWHRIVAAHVDAYADRYYPVVQEGMCQYNCSNQYLHAIKEGVELNPLSELTLQEFNLLCREFNELREEEMHRTIDEDKELQRAFVRSGRTAVPGAWKQFHPETSKNSGWDSSLVYPPGWKDPGFDFDEFMSRKRRKDEESECPVPAKYPRQQPPTPPAQPHPSQQPSLAEFGEAIRKMFEKNRNPPHQ